jgi:hypothetical protein
LTGPRATACQSRDRGNESDSGAREKPDRGKA